MHGRRHHRGMRRRASVWVLVSCGLWLGATATGCDGVTAVDPGASDAGASDASSDARAIVAKYGIDVPASVRARLDAGICRMTRL